MDFMKKDKIIENRKSKLYNAQTKLDIETAEWRCEENSTKPKKSMDETLASILKDLELAEVSLQSTSHLIEPTEGESEEVIAPATNPLTYFNSIIKEIRDIKVEESVSTFCETNANGCDLTFDEQVKLLTSRPELKEESFQSSENVEENILPSEEPPTESESSTTTNVEVSNENYPEDQHSTDMDHQNTSNESKDDAELKIPLPGTNSYFNFVQDFQAKYSGDEVTTSMLAALALAKWRKMEKEEKQKYKNMKKSHCEKDVRVEKLRKYIKSMNISEEAIFQTSH